MKHYSITIALALLHVPFLVAAQCPACDSYQAALKSCKTNSADTQTVGDTMDTSTVHCMCQTKSTSAQQNTCTGCAETNSNANLDITVLLAWYTTCTASETFDDKQAVLCWESQPTNILPCIEAVDNTGDDSSSSGSGSGTGGDSGNDSEATSSASSPSPSKTLSNTAAATNTASSPSKTATPSARATSQATMSYEAAFGILSIGLVGLLAMLGV
ncbi:MAG: hypothetical protein Q9190_001187 [Brigantiaea leucoxantha]